MKPSTYLLAAAVCGLGLPFARMSAAQPALATPRPANAPKVILFVGNSFTHGLYPPVSGYNSGVVTDENFALPSSTPAPSPAPQSTDKPRPVRKPVGGIPGIFLKMTQEAGLSYEVHVEAVGGKNLEFHYQNKLPIIAQAKWDIVVMHDHSAGPLPAIRNSKPNNAPKGDDAAATENTGGAGDSPGGPSKLEVFLKHSVLLEKAIHGANPAAKVYLYATWPCPIYVYPEGSMYNGEKLDVMGADLHEGYYRAFAEDGHYAGVAPVGDAWLRAIHEGVAVENPYQLPPDAGKLDLWGPDHKHPSSSGSYLAALVLFQQVTGKDARTLGKDEQAAATLKISPENAARLQQVAFEQVTAKPVAAVK